MTSLNYVCLLGTLARDVELRQLPSGMSVADMRLAVPDEFVKRNGEKSERICFVDVVVWDRQAENCAKYLGKGSPILVEGRLQLDEWQNKEGQKRSVIRIRADRVQFLGAPRRTSEYSDTPTGPASVAPRPSAAYAGDGAPEPVAPAPVRSGADPDDLPF